MNKFAAILGDVCVQDTEAVVVFVKPDLEWQGDVNFNISQKLGAAFDESVLDYFVSPKPGEVAAFDVSGLGVFRVAIVCVAPKWEDGLQQEDRELLRCYRGILDAAVDAGVGSVSLPAMGKGQRRFPHERAARIAVRAMQDFSDDRIKDVRIVCDEQKIFDVYHRRVSC